jgi:hypothetical protein
MTTQITMLMTTQDHSPDANIDDNSYYRPDENPGDNPNGIPDDNPGDYIK